MRFLGLIAAALAAGTAAAPVTNATISTRAELGPRAILKGPDGGHGFCDVSHKPRASFDSIIDGIVYLRGVTKDGGKCGTAARECNRVSCSWGSAIYVCNDNDYDIDPSCALIAKYTEVILNHCRTLVNHKINYVDGQLFNDAAGWNVMVHWARC